MVSSSDKGRCFFLRRKEIFFNMLQAYCRVDGGREDRKRSGKKHEGDGREDLEAVHSTPK